MRKKSCLEIIYRRRTVSTGFYDIIPPLSLRDTSCLGRAISVLEWVTIPTKLIPFHADAMAPRVGERQKLGEIMAVIPMKALLESGVHFGHRTNKWDPRMKPYIFTERNGIHIIDLQQTS